MIYINKDTTNEFALTLTESTTITDPFFLFKFVWEYDESIDPIYWVGTDYSSYPNRYNLFYIDEPIDLEFRQGQYKYEVYESATGNEVDETGLEKIEEGRMVVYGDGNTIYD
jgi:hypothetical protein